MFKVLFVFMVLAHHRRRVVHVNVTDAPTTQWTAQQLVEAFPWETAPRYPLRDRDAVYGVVFSSQAQAMGIQEVKTAPRSPWQNPYVERLIGTLRRECLDHRTAVQSLCTADPITQAKEARMARDEKVKVTIRLSRELLKKGKHYAIDHDVDFQDVVADALAAWLKRGDR
jgi:Integrase core domain